MKLGRGNVFGAGLTAAQRRVLERLERGELTASQAEQLLVSGSVVAEPFDLKEPDEQRPHETPEEAEARALVERIAREVDAER